MSHVIGDNPIKACRVSALEGIEESMVVRHGRRGSETPSRPFRASSVPPLTYTNPCVVDAILTFLTHLLVRPPLCVSQLVRITKLAIPTQQKRISAQQATGIQQAPGGGFRLAGEETVLIPAPGAYPTSLSAESSECLHQGLRVVYVLAQYMPKYLEVSEWMNEKQSWF